MVMVGEEGWGGEGGEEGARCQLTMSCSRFDYEGRTHRIGSCVCVFVPLMKRRRIFSTSTGLLDPNKRTLWRRARPQRFRRP